MHRSDVVVGLSDREMCSVLQQRLSELEYTNVKVKRQNRELEAEKNSLELKLSDIEKKLGSQNYTKMMQEIDEDKKEAEKKKALLEFSGQPKYEVTIGKGQPMYFCSMKHIEKVLGFSSNQINHALVGFPLHLVSADKDVWIKALDILN